jgi:hypothetical protein
MKKIAIITLALVTTGLATVYTAPAFAQDSQALCKLMATYTPGVDVHGNAVVPADLKAAAGANDVIKIPVTIDLAKTLTQNLPAGTEMDAAVSMIEIHKDGKVMYNGQDVTQQASAVCASATAPAADAAAQAGLPGEIDIPAPGAEDTPPPADLSAPAIDAVPAPAAAAPEPAAAPVSISEPAPAPAPEPAPVEAAAPAPEAAPAVEEAAPVEAAKPAKPAKPRYTEAMRKADQEATAAAEAAARAAVVGGTATMGTSAPSAPIGDGASAAPAVETGTVDHAASGGDFGEDDPQIVGERAAMQAGVNLGSTVKASSNAAASSSASVTTDVPPPAAAPAAEAAPAPAATEKKEEAIIWGEGN